MGDDLGREIAGQPSRRPGWQRVLGGLTLATLVLGLLGGPRPSPGGGDLPPEPLSDAVRAKYEQKARDVELYGATGPELRYDQPDAAAEREVAKRAVDGVTPPDPELYVAARAHVANMARFSLATGELIVSPLAQAKPTSTAELEAELAALATWSPLGPGNVGGRVRALVVHPTQPATMWAAGVSGGVFKTTNGGSSWSPLTDFLPNLAVSTLAIDPSNASILYAGTGEGIRPWEYSPGALRGAGIFKTSNGGTTWTRLVATATSDFYYVNDIVVSKSNPARVYAATGTGVWRSTDSGATWTRVLTHNGANGSPSEFGCLDLAIRTDLASDWLLASCGSSDGAAVYLNTAAEGGSWSVKFSSNGVTGMGRTSLAIAPSDQSIVYALVTDANAGSTRSGMLGVVRSTDGGDRWFWRVQSTDPKKINTTLLSNTKFAFYSVCNPGSSDAWYNQGWYDNVIAVDPVNPDRVWAGGVDLYRSDNAGADWGLASYWDGAGSTRYAHADQHAIVFHPNYNGTTNRQMFVGNDGGVFKTSDTLATVATQANAPCNTNNSSVTWTSLANGLGITQFYDGTVYPDGTRYFGGTQDNGTVWGRDSLGINGWLDIQGGDGGYVAVNPSDTNVLYVEVQNRNIRKTSNNGTTWVFADTGLPDNGCGTAAPGVTACTHTSDEFLFITPFEIDPSNSSRLWIGGLKLYRTTNGAGSWAQASGNLSGAYVSAIGISPQDGNRVVAGTSDGFISRSTSALSAGAATQWASAQPRSGWVSSLAYDPSDSQVIYATYATFGGKHVWRSNDGGASWSSIDGSGASGLPNIPVHSIVVDPTDGARLYVGTDLGVFVTLDRGASWAQENTGFANVVTEKLEMWQSGGQRRLYAFTHGRGAFRVDIGATPAPANDAFASAVSVGETAFSAETSTVAATTQAGENTAAASCALSQGASMGHTVWYRLQPTVTTEITATTVGSNYDTVLAVWRGTTLAGLAEVGCNDDIDNAGGNRQSSFSFTATPGNTYYFQVGGFGSDAGSLKFNVSGVPQAPLNDAFSGAVAADVSSFVAQLSTGGATTQAGENTSPAGCSLTQAMGHTVWYRLAPAIATQITATTEGSSYDTVLAVWRGTALAGLTEVACNDDIDNPGGNRQSRVAFTAQAGSTYYLQVGGWGTGSGDLVFTSTGMPPPPANDGFGAAASINDPSSFSAQALTGGATIQQGEVTSPAACGLGAGKSMGHTVWYRMTPASRVDITVETVGSDYDTVLAVWRGATLGTLAEVACNDDIDVGDLNPNRQSRVLFTADAGVTYYFQVGGWETSSGALAFRITGSSPAPPNDTFAGAIAIANPISFQGTASVDAATTQAGEDIAPAVCQLGEATIGHTLWYRMAPTTTTALTVSTVGSTYDTVLVVWRGTTLGGLTAVGCDDDIGGATNRQSRVSFTAQAGSTYYLQIGGWGTSAGDLAVTSSATPPPPANDAFSSAAPISNQQAFTSSVTTIAATTEPGEVTAPAACQLGQGSIGHTVWYRLRPDAKTEVTAETIGSEFDTVLAVYRGGSLAGLTEVTCNDDIDGADNRRSRVAFTAQAGTTYYFQVGGYGTRSGDLAFSYLGQISAECDGLVATIVGTPGDDNLSGTNGNDVIVGLGGNDVIEGLGGHDVICGGDGDDTLVGGAGNDRLFGDAGHDRLLGNRGNDVLDGGAGNDLLRGDSDDDNLIGGKGADTASYQMAGSTVTVSLLTGVATGGDDTDSLRGIEHLTGSNHADLLTGSARSNNIVGGRGNDTIRGLDGADVLEGGPGNDSIDGGSGEDRIRHRGATARVTVNLNQGTAVGGTGSDSLLRIERITGTRFGDDLTGDGADNVFQGGAGNDTLRGAGGNDRLYGGPGNDTINGGPGTDTCSGETVSACETVQTSLPESAPPNGAPAGKPYVTKADPKAAIGQ